KRAFVEEREGRRRRMGFERAQAEAEQDALLDPDFGAPALGRGQGGAGLAAVQLTAQLGEGGEGFGADGSEIAQRRETRDRRRQISVAHSPSAAITRNRCWRVSSRTGTSGSRSVSRQ